MKNLRSLAVALGLAGLVLAGCSSGGTSSGDQSASGQAGGSSTGGDASSAERPSSTGSVIIDAPRNGQIVKGANLTLKLELKGAKIVQATTTRIRPDEGHVHVMLDGKLISMNYQLSQKLPKLGVGTHLVQVEFVAADHQPFDPRVLTQAAFQVSG
jgi:hypothetical protein